MRVTKDASLPNTHTVVVGRSGSRKTTWVKRQVKNARRLIVWDPHEDYPVTRYDRLAPFIQALRTTGPLQVGLTVDATPEAFERWCRAVRLVLSADRPTTVVAEEIAEVTSPSKASPEWGKLARGSRKFGGILYAITQRPQESDKTIYTQADYLWVGRIAQKDRKYLADELELPQARLAELKKGEYFYKGPDREATKHKV
jgi:hypothetical protein